MEPFHRKKYTTPESKDILIGNGPGRLLHVGKREIDGLLIDAWAVPGGGFVARRRAEQIARELADEHPAR